MKKNMMTRVFALFMTVLMLATAVSISAIAETATEAVETEVEVLGEGTTVFSFEVTDGEGTVKSYEIHTDAETVGSALQELELIDGEDSSFGLYVKTVSGITADYDQDGTYWAFYVNGEYGTTGVDSTPVENGGVYAFKVEK